MFKIGLVLGIILAAFIGLWASVAIPNLKTLEERKVIESTKIYDRSGQILLYDVHSDIKRTIIPFDKIPKSLKNAVISIEDADFYKHGGFSISSTVRAFIVDLISGEFKQGGSTITQQLAKQVFLTADKSVVRKAKEIILAIKLERAYSKDEILNLYLNEIPYGGANYGVESAAETFFGKPAEKLSLAESVYLAAIPNAPTRYSPYGTHTDELEARKNLALARMKDLGFISADEFEKTRNEKVAFINRGADGFKAPHFVMYVKEKLVADYGEDAVDSGGLKVTTTLDWEMQKKAEELVRSYGASNAKTFNANNAGLVAIDPKTGQILTMVGSRDYFDFNHEGNFNVTLARRQPGSSIKPFVYATAFAKGYTPETTLFDLPTEFNANCNPDGSAPAGYNPDNCYHPQNYDNNYRAPISLRNALAQSVNIPSVKLLYLAGISNSLGTARRLGISTLNDPARYGLTLVLGGGEVELLEMTGAYAGFANDGNWNSVTPILKVENSSGNILEEYKNQSTLAIDQNIARTINDVLSDNIARTPAFGANSTLFFPDRDVAVKTGTTNDYRDAWVIGYTPNIVVGVWAGNNDNSPMEKKVAGFIAAPLWSAFLKEALKTLPSESFIPPAPTDPGKSVLKGNWQGGKSFKINRLTGKLATPNTPENLIEERVVRQVHTILNWVNKDDPAGPIPDRPESDPQFKNWEAPIRAWAAAHGLADESENVIPTTLDDAQISTDGPQASANFYPDSEIVLNGTEIDVSFDVKDLDSISQIDLFLGSNFLGSIESPPYQSSFIVTGTVDSEIEFKANVYDLSKNKTTITKTFKILGN